MEKSIHSHLFAALVSTKEQRLAFMASTPEQQKFDEAAAQIESAIEDPTKLTTELIPKIAELKVSAIADKENSKRVDQLNRIVDAKTALQVEISETEKKTAESNADWKKITEDIKSPDATKKDAAVEAGKKLIVDSRARMNELSAGIVSLDDLEPKLLAKITVKTIAAHNKVIENVQALDPDNTIELVPEPRVGGEEAKNALKAIEERGAEFISKDLNDALKAVKDAVGPNAQKLAKAALDKVVKNRREEIYTKIVEATGDPEPYVNAEKQVAALLGQLKDMNDEIKAVTQPTEVSATPPATPNDPQTAANADPKAPKSIFDKVTDAFKNAIGNVSALAQDFVKKGTDAFNTFQDSLSKEQKEKLVDKLNDELKKKGEDKRVELNKDGRIVEAAKDGATTDKEKSGETTKEPEEKEKTQLEKLLAFFKELIEFLRGESVKNGDLGALKSEVQSIDEQIAKIKKDTPDFDKKPEVQKQITDLEVKRNELQLKIDQGTKITNRVLTDAERFISSSPSQLFVRTGKDRQGNAFIACTKDTPEARGHLSYMTGRLQQIHPGLGFNQQAAGGNQRVSFHFHGDVNINSKNTTDNSRTINNTNNVSGRNNTVSASADGSQNGANTQEQIGGVGAEQDSSARNRARLTPDVQVQPAPIPQPRRARIVDVPPPTGNLS